MIPQPYHPMMMPHHIHGNHPMMYPQPPHHHPMNFMDPDVDDEEMFVIKNVAINKIKFQLTNVETIYLSFE